MASHFRHRFFINQFTSSAKLGFRIEGYTHYSSDGSKCQTKGSDIKPRTRGEIGNENEFRKFFKDKEFLIKKVIKKLRKLEKALCSSEWFWHHELICSSLMIILYADKATVHMIDFGKTVCQQQRISHDIPWKLGNHEDGYLIGLRNLQRILHKLKPKNNKLE